MNGILKIYSRLRYKLFGFKVYQFKDQNSKSFMTCPQSTTPLSSLVHDQHFYVTVMTFPETYTCCYHCLLEHFSFHPMGSLIPFKKDGLTFLPFSPLLCWVLSLLLKCSWHLLPSRIWVTFLIFLIVQEIFKVNFYVFFFSF
jgi:hypothetical protein